MSTSEQGPYRNGRKSTFAQDVSCMSPLHEEPTLPFVEPPQTDKLSPLSKWLSPIDVSVLPERNNKRPAQENVLDDFFKPKPEDRLSQPTVTDPRDSSHPFDPLKGGDGQVDRYKAVDGTEFPATPEGVEAMRRAEAALYAGQPILPKLFGFKKEHPQIDVPETPPYLT